MAFIAKRMRGWRARRRHRGGRGEPGLPSSADRIDTGYPNLNDVEPGGSCRVRRLHGCGAIRQRLLDMGLVPDTAVTVIRRAPLRDPIEVHVGGSFITLRRAEASKIEVLHG